jgi:membrane protein implicated in regulation of membrane protease activity
VVSLQVITKVFFSLWVAYMVIVVSLFAYFSVINPTLTVLMAMVGTLIVLQLARRSLKDRPVTEKTN